MTEDEEIILNIFLSAVGLLFGLFGAYCIAKMMRKRREGDDGEEALMATTPMRYAIQIPTTTKYWVRFNFGCVNSIEVMRRPEREQGGCLRHRGHRQGGRDRRIALMLCRTILIRAYRKYVASDINASAFCS